MRGFAHRLRVERERARLNQTQLAKRSGVATSQISRFEGEDRIDNMAAATVVRLAVALGVRVGWLLCGELPRYALPEPQPIVVIEEGAPTAGVDAIHAEVGTARKGRKKPEARRAGHKRRAPVGNGHKKPRARPGS